MSGKNRKQKKSINLLQFKGGSWVTENEMQWTHQRLIANHNGHRWDHRKSQRTHSPKLETFSLTHLLSLLQNLKNQNQQEKKKHSQFQNIRRRIRQHTNHNKKKKTSNSRISHTQKTKQQLLPTQTPTEELRERIDSIEQKGFAIWERFRSIQWFRGKKRVNGERWWRKHGREKGNLTNKLMTEGRGRALRCRRRMVILLLPNGNRMVREYYEVLVLFIYDLWYE